MHVEFLIEEPSAEAALQNLLPAILGSAATFALHAFRGKRDLLAKVPSRLRGYSSGLPTDWRIVVLVDRDCDDCRALKARLEHAATDAGLATRGAPRGQTYQVLTRLAIEELESWFPGDCEALRAAYPKLSRSLERSARLRDPDAVQGGTWETLERLLQRAGYHPSGMPKIDVARRVSAHMDPSRNRSRSFQVFCEGLQAMVGQR